jgi:hypothetical protein
MSKRNRQEPSKKRGRLSWRGSRNRRVSHPAFGLCVSAHIHTDAGSRRDLPWAALHGVHYLPILPISPLPITTMDAGGYQMPAPPAEIEPRMRTQCTSFSAGALPGLPRPQNQAQDCQPGTRNDGGVQAIKPALVWTALSGPPPYAAPSPS